METKLLEDTRKTVLEKCSYCDSPLDVDYGIHERVNNSKSNRLSEDLEGDYQDYYVGRYKGYYCNSNHYDMFLAD